jgi:hypothetical protein
MIVFAKTEYNYSDLFTKNCQQGYLQVICGETLREDCWLNRRDRNDNVILLINHYGSKYRDSR